MAVKLNRLKPYGIIYKIENKINGKVYIGLTTKSLEKRLNEHVTGKKKTSLIGNALKKYKLDSFSVNVIDVAFFKEDLCGKEKQLIIFYNCKHPNGYNLTDGGEGLLNPTQEIRDKIGKASKGRGYLIKGIRRSKETLIKLSQSHKGIRISEETKEKLRIASTGRKHTEEEKRKIGEGRLGKRHSEATKEKLRKPKSEETKKKMRESCNNKGKNNPMYGRSRRGKDNPMYGKHHSEESKQKMSETHINKNKEKLNESNKHKNS